MRTTLQGTSQRATTQPRNWQPLQRLAGAFLGLFMLAGGPAAQAQTPTTVFNETFEATNSFTVVNGTQTNQWYVGTVPGNGPTTTGTKAAYISNDGGVSHAYTISPSTATSVVHLYRDVTLPAGQSVITLGFDWFGGGESTYDYLRVQVAPTTYTPTSGTLPGTTDVTQLAQVNLQPAYGRTTLQLPGSLAGTTQRLIFTWRNDGSGGTQPPVALDNITVQARTASPLNGVYTINSTQPTAGTNFISFNDAALRLNTDGVSGAVTFNVSAGPYTEQLVLNDINGVSATNTVRFNGNGRTLQFGSSNTNQRAVVTLNGADYVTIDSLNIDATNGGSAGTYGWGVHLTNNADYNTIRRCVVTSDPTSTSSNFAGIIMSASATGATTSGNSGSNLTLENNTISGGYYGITMVGNSTASPTTGNIARNNTVRDFYFYGIYNLYNQGTTITGNDVNRLMRTATSTFYGIYLSTGSNGATVTRNRIHDSFANDPTSTSVTYAIYVTTGTGSAALTTTVANNLLYNLSGAGTRYGIYNPGSSYVNYYYNTLSLDAPASVTSTNTSYGFYQTTGTNVEFKNNIVVVDRAGTGTKYGIYFSSTTGSTASNYNDLYVPNGNVGYLSTARATLTDWRATGNDANSVSADPIFTSATNLRPNNAALNNAATPIASVTTDFTGATRGTTPDIGAYEFTPANLDLAPVMVVNPTTTAGCYGTAETITVQIRNNGANALNFATNPATVTVAVTSPGGTVQNFTATVNTGTLASGTTQNVTLPGTLNMSALGTYSFAVTATVIGDLNTSNDVLTPAPTRTVVAPTAGTVSPSGTTLCVSGTAALTLNGSANGNIQWQQSTNGTTFTNIAGATSAAYTTPTLTQTTYYRATVTCNTNVVTTNVSTITVNNPQLTGTNTPVNICAGNTATLTATSTGGGDIRWFDTATSTTPLATGPSFTTPVLTTTRSYYVAAVAGAQENVGKASTTGADGTNTAGGLYFTTTGPTTIANVTVYRTAGAAAGSATIHLLPGSTTSTTGSITSVTVPVPANTATTVSPTVLTLNIAVPAAGSYTLYLSAATPNLIRDYSTSAGVNFPYTSPSGNVTITNGSLSGYYYFFYNWQIGSECAGSRTTVQVNVTPGPVSTFSYPATGGTTGPLGYCAGNATGTVTPVLGASATAGTFTASPAGLTINPTTGVVTLATSTAGTYTITNTVAATGGSCPASTSTATLVISPVPAAPTLTGVPQPNGSVVLLSSAGTSQFYLNGTPIAGAIGSLYTATQNGAYTVTVTSAAGCTSPASAPYQVGPLATRSALPGTSLNVYPNPTPNGKFTLELHGYTQAAELTVFDAVGRQVHTRTLKAGTQREALDLSALPAGVYSLRVTTQGGVDVQRLVRE